MAQSVVIEIGVDDKGTPVLKDITERIAKMSATMGVGGKAADEMSKSNDNAAGVMSKVPPQAAAIGVALSGVAVAAAGVGVAIGGMLAAVHMSIEAFREQDEVDRALERSLRAAGAAGEPLRKQLDAIGGSIATLADQTMYGDEQLSKMASTFINISGRATATQEDLELIADIAAGMGVDGEQAARTYANALSGQLEGEISKTTAITQEQVLAINESTDAAERAKLAQEALSTAYGGTASDLNPLFRATKNLQDAQGDLAQAAGRLFAESGALEPVVDLVTASFRRLESWINDNSVAIQHFIIDGVIFAVGAVSSLIGTMQQMAPVISGVIEATRHVIRNFQIMVTATNVVIRSAQAFGVALQSGVIDIMIKVLDAGIAVAEFFDRDLPTGIKESRAALVDIGDGIQDDMVRYLDDAGESVDAITAKLIENSQFTEDVAEGSARIAGGLQGAADVAGNLLESLRQNRAEIEAISDEEDSEGTDRPPEGVGGDGLGKEEEKNAARERMAQEHADRIAQIRLAALTEEDERMAIILENEAQRQELAAQEISDAERQLSAMRLEIQLAQDLGAVDEQEHQERMKREQELQAENEKRIKQAQTEAQAKEQLLQQTLRGFDAQLGGAGNLAASIRELSEAEWNFEEATSATLSAFQGLAQVGGSVANAITEDKEKAAKIEAAFSAAAAIGSFAAFAATGFTAAPLGIAAAQHAIAAAQYAAIAGGAGGSKKPSSTSASASGGGGRSARDAQMIDREQGQGMRPIVFHNNFNGTFMEDSNAIDRKISNASQRAAQNRFVAGRGRGR